jgi:hypothetical protein
LKALFITDPISRPNPNLTLTFRRLKATRIVSWNNIALRKFLTEAIAAIYLSPQQELATTPIVDSIPGNILEVTSRAQENGTKETTQPPVKQILLAKQFDEPGEEPLKTENEVEDLLDKGNLPAPVASDGDTAVVKQSKKGKKNKKKSQ